MEGMEEKDEKEGKHSQDAAAPRKHRKKGEAL